MHPVHTKWWADKYLTHLSSLVRIGPIHKWAAVMSSDIIGHVISAISSATLRHETHIIGHVDVV